MYLKPGKRRSEPAKSAWSKPAGASSVARAVAQCRAAAEEPAEAAEQEEEPEEEECDRAELQPGLGWARKATAAVRKGGGAPGSGSFDGASLAGRGWHGASGRAGWDWPGLAHWAPAPHCLMLGCGLLGGLEPGSTDACNEVNVFKSIFKYIFFKTNN